MQLTHSFILLVSFASTFLPALSATIPVRRAEGSVNATEPSPPGIGSVSELLGLIAAVLSTGDSGLNLRETDDKRTVNLLDLPEGTTSPLSGLDLSNLTRPVEGLVSTQEGEGVDVDSVLADAQGLTDEALIVLDQPRSKRGAQVNQPGVASLPDITSLLSSLVGGLLGNDSPATGSLGLKRQVTGMDQLMQQLVPILNGCLDAVDGNSKRQQPGVNGLVQTGDVDLQQCLSALINEP